MASLLNTLTTELFEKGRVAEGVPQVAQEIAANAGTTLEREGLTLATRQMEREHTALARDMYEATGNAVAGATPDKIVRGFMKGRFSQLPVDGWSVANNSALRSKLVDTALNGIKDKLPVPDITQNMQQVHSKVVEEVVSVPSVSEVAPFTLTPPPVPTAERMAKSSSAPPPQSNIGSYGTVAFQVARENTVTPEKFSISRPARFAEHAILHAKPKGQSLGIGLRDISLTIKLVHPFCKVPAKRIEELETIQESEEAYPLILGGRNYGNYVLLNLDVTVTKFGYGGAIQAAEVQLKLKEYV